MSLRTSNALAVMLPVLAACSPAGEQRRRDEPPRPTPTPSASPEAPLRIACARGDKPLAPTCGLEEDRGEGALIVRFPDGGFRRIRVTGDGRGVIAADGAEPAQVAVVDPRGDDVEVEVRIGDDRFRLPAHAAHAGP